MTPKSQPRRASAPDMPAGATFVGMRIPPCWRIVPAGEPPDEASLGQDIRLVVDPGAGFGTGSHATTQLCLRAMAAFAPRGGRPWKMLDLGSGSGILSIAAAKLGAMVRSVEIDEAAIANAEDNMRLNGVSDRIRVSRALDPTDGPHEMVVANILRAVLLAFAPELTARLAPGGTLVLSGLLATDLPELSVRYAGLLGHQRPDIHALGEWRALSWRTPV